MSQKLHGERLVFFERRLRELIRYHKPDYIVIESVFKGRNAKTTIVLSWYHGVAYKVVYELLKKAPWMLTPTEARSIVGDKYKVNLSPTKEQKKKKITAKKLTFDFIKSKYKLKGFDFKNDNDITDGIALALAGQVLLKDSKARQACFKE